LPINPVEGSGENKRKFLGLARRGIGVICYFKEGFDGNF